MKNFFLIIFLFIFSIEVDQYFSDIFLDTEKFSIIIYIEDTKTYNAIADLESEFSYIDDNTLPLTSLPSANKINEKLTFQIDNIESKGIEVKDNASLNKNTLKINDFSFIIYPSSISKLKSISFGYKYRKNHNLIYLMKKSKLINKAQFTIEINNNSKGKIYYGEIPNDILNPYKYTLNIPVKSNNKNWDFELGFLFIGEISYKYENTYYYNQNKASFSGNSKGILAPEMAFDFIIDNVFNDSIKKNICRKTISENNEIECMCDKLKEENLKHITFIINDRSIIFNTKEYFDIIGNRCVFQIKYNNFKRDEWKFGISFLSKFLSTFDYEKGEIILRTKEKNFEEVDVNTLFPLKKMIIWTLVIVIILLIPFMYKITKESIKKHRERRINAFIKENYTQLEPVT
jgi:hypothetical protein